jgi:hypothetical protein
MRPRSVKLVIMVLLLSSCGEARRTLRNDEYRVFVDSATTLRIYGPCTESLAVAVEEDDNAVWLKVVAGEPNKKLCASETILELEEPLKGRTIRDLESGELVSFGFNGG